MHTKLNKRVLETTPLPANGSLFLRDTELRGFGARLSPKGAITFFAEGRIKRGRNKRVSLGRYPVLTVEAARERAREALYKLSAGTNPVSEAKAKAEAERTAHALERAGSVTLSEVLDDYFRSRPIKSEPAYRGAIKNSFEDWLNRPVRAITRQDVESRYRKIAFKDGHKAQAAKAMRCLSAVLNFASVELVDGQPLLADNPVDVLKERKVDRAVKPRDHHIPRNQIARVVRAVLSECTATARDVVLLELFTGLRDGEAKGLRWQDVNFDDRTVTVPETKNGKPHVFSMGLFIEAMLRHRFSDRSHRTWVFPNRVGSGPLGSVRKQLLRVHKKARIKFTHHDLRRTFATLLSAELGVSSDIIGRLLNHSPKGVTERHYIHTDPTKLTPLYDQLYELVTSELDGLDLAQHLYPTSPDDNEEEPLVR